ncbi:MAG: Lrp/AsnC family transcriptional regulator [Candidatus Devosia euplotis]|nr:Lrp/AsnC family transcriptional regulator [Candidatus Devosia euplotis]
MRELESSGVIRDYTAIIDGPTPGDTIVAIVQITLERQTDDVLRRFEQALRGCAEVHECYLMAGLSNYLARVEAASVVDYERLPRSSAEGWLVLQPQLLSPPPNEQSS